MVPFVGSPSTADERICFMNEKETVEYVTGRGEQSAQHQEEMLARVVDAKKALHLAMETVRQEWIDWDEKAKSMLQDARMWRMAIDSEFNRALGAFQDVRKFFLSSEHDKEVARLKEFVELCERLQTLKQSGFLDQVADTILKLEGT